MNNKEISIIIPAYNEAENLPFLCDEIKDVLKNITENYEIIIVNDGSTDKTKEAIENLTEKDSHVIGINFRTNLGKASALNTGFKKAEGKIIFTMDADLQDDPKEIPNFIKRINEGFDLVSGWKQNRKDSFIKK